MLTKPRRAAMQEINSSSMSDIAFLLLVFFLVTTTISLDKGISLILPADGNELEVNRKNITSILVNDKGKVLMDDQPIKINQIKSKALKKIGANSNIIFSVTTHKNTKFDDYIQVLDQLKQANATKISIANPPSF
jgi:biopolymer transport protein ExbD|tara:strand:+ start:231 stop:635 length:405 start_codon:yes stop_codon:yes gene_type:complete